MEGNYLIVGKDNLRLKLRHNVHIVAFGKAVVGMVKAAEDILGEHVQSGIASIPVNYMNTFKPLNKPLVQAPTIKFYIYACLNICFISHVVVKFLLV